MMEIVNLEDHSNYRLCEISQINYYFSEEIQYQQSLTNKLSKYLNVVFSGTNTFSSVNNKQLLGLITSVISLPFSLSFGIIIKF